MSGRLKTALVLGGGGARGAYEAGVLAWLREELEPELGRPLPLDILVGTSVGAIHACYLAATSEVPHRQAAGLSAQWAAMRVEEILRFGYGDLLRLVRESFGRPSHLAAGVHAGGLVDPRGLRALVGRAVPWLHIGRNLRRGHLQALAVSTTHVGSGRTTVFVQRREGGTPAWGNDAALRVEAARIGPNHALASAAIPVLFPAVRLQGQLHVDGGLRLNVPLSPALRLGAERVVVISLRPKAPPSPAAEQPLGATDNEEALASAPFLVGKMLNALLVDRTDKDLDQLRRLNALLEAGTTAYGPGFEQTLNAALLPHRNQPVRYVRELLVRPSVDLATLAAEYVQSSAFRRGPLGLAHRAILHLMEREAARAADLASYLLFDGGFAEQLIELGRQDARALREEWLRFWSEEPQSAAEAAQMAAARSAA